MLYADFNDILISVCYSALFGIIMGILFVALSVLIYTIDGFIRLPKTIYQASDSLSKIRNLFINSENCKYAKNKVKVFLFDFIYVIINGLLFSLLLYITTDGVFRLYILIISLTLARLFIKYLGNHTASFLNKSISFLYSVITIVFSLLLFPTRKVIRLTINLIRGKFKKQKRADIVQNN